MEFFFKKKKGRERRKEGGREGGGNGGRKRGESHDLSAFVIYPSIQRSSKHTYIIHSVLSYFICFTLITTLREPFFKQGNKHTMVK